MRFSLFGRDVGIDIGTVNTLIARRDSGIVLRESTAVALDREKRLVAVGEEAYHMLGRTPGDVRVMHPLQDGVVVDFQLCEAMLRHFLLQAAGHPAGRFGARAVLCVPGCVTKVEKRALEDAARNAGARAAFMLDEPVAAALGAGLPVEEPLGTLVVDIGGGTTDAAVIALGGIVVKRSIRAGGTHIDAAIMQHVRRTYGIVIGARTAELIKIGMGSALPAGFGSMQVRGRDMGTGLPCTLNVSAMEVYRAIQPQVRAILGCVREVLSLTPPELAGDIYERGMWLTGGGALLNGVADLFASVTGISTYIAERPLDCVAEGARRAVENIAFYRERAV
ncbi:MAG: rod shape-determining protein [Clostridiales bacterium]|jgi:rod shape-determining protein MreB|nr:rod shape-determining protein [Clostridiales bacterium]